ncbi:hypothetical protein [Halobacteriovorax sp. CON-3]|uniref:hypothetical protein n=1 Tax=Halobacteriovorax sp. CON-3 TaxID=3157710 RepID=UPI0037183504
MKSQILFNNYTDFNSALELTIDNSNLSPRNSRRKYTKRKHWLETTNRGTRYCYATYDESRKAWCSPKKTTFSPFKYMVLADNDIKTVTISRYSNPVDIKKLFERYDFPECEKKKLSLLADGLTEAKKRSDNIVNKILEEKKAKARKLTDYENGKVYTEGEIVKSVENMPTLRIQLVGYAIKKRCRKSEYFRETIGFLLDTEENRKMDKVELYESLKEKISEITSKSFREVKEMTFQLKVVEYKAPYEGGIYHGFSESLSIGFSRDDSIVFSHKLV